METSPIINKIDKSIMAFVNQITEPYKDDQDIKLFNEILKGERFPEGTVYFKLNIGSSRRLKVYYGENNSNDKEKQLNLLSYNEFKIQLKITSKSFHLMTTIFHNEINQIEGMSYNIDSTNNSCIADETWILTEGDYFKYQSKINGRKPEIFFEEICKLHKLDRDIKTSSELEPTEEVYEIKKRFDELMQSAAEKEIDWAISNELASEEKIRVLQNLSPSRKLQIIQNLTNENSN